MHLQDAYFAEMNEVGDDATAIGYNAPASNVFTYNVASKTWTAKAKTSLDKCPENSEWKVASSKASGSGKSGVSHSATTPEEKADCASLTPSFTNIGAATK